MRLSTRWRIGVAAVAAVAVAEAAVWLLRPRAAIPDPAKVQAHSYFSEAQIERAGDYRGGQRLILLGTLAVEGGLIVLLAAGRPRAVRRALERAGAKPLAGAAAAGAGISLALGAATLPVGAIAHERAVEYGLSTQTLAAWLGDQGKSAAIGAMFAAAGATALIALIRRFPRRWWIPASGALVGVACVFVWLAPVVLQPLFNRFDPLPEGRDRAEVLSLARRAGVDVGEVYRVDASRRSTGLNAYVDGLGPTKRVVVYDNLLEKGDRELLPPVLAHELSHVKDRDILRGLAWLAIVTPVAMLFIRELADRLAARTGARPGAPATLPALVLAISLTAFVLGSVSSQLSRKVEARADAFSLELTRDPRSMIELQQALATSNLAEPDPPAALHWLLGTHPSTMERIGAAVSFERSEAGATRPDR